MSAEGSLRIAAAALAFAASLGCARQFSVPPPPSADDPRLKDADGDGFSPAGGDCDDANPAAHPGAFDLCDNGVDEDCSGADALCKFTDADGDGYPVKDENGAVVDCNDQSVLVHPRAPEVCDDDIDQDCDGQKLACADVDGDRDGYTPRAGDCDDDDPLTHPDAVDLCGDGKDQDCEDGDQDCNALDRDQDGFTPAAGDCNDTSPLVNPRAREVCDNQIDEDCAGGDLDCDLADQDGDGYAVLGGGDFPGGDCDDADRRAYPLAPEICGDGHDQDCAGGDLDCLDADADRDGYTPRAGDCNDQNPLVNARAREVCGNSVDDDCKDGDLPCNLADEDGDGYAVASGGRLPGGDCNDGDLLVNPRAREICGNAVDEDCAGGPLTCDVADEDGDGYAVAAGGAFPSGDCNDHSPLVRPFANEICENGVDEDCAPEPEGWAVPFGGDNPVHDRLCPEHADPDADGFAPESGVGLPYPGGDCDSRRIDVYPGGVETCDFADNDCDGTVDAGIAECDHFDHQNLDYTPAAGDAWTLASAIYPGRLTLGGVHFRIGKFTVPSGRSVGPVEMQSGAVGGGVEIRARDVEIAGALTAAGSGWGGGGGGPGGYNPTCTNFGAGNNGLGARGGSKGSASTNTFCIGVGIYGAGGTGGGPFAGAGATENSVEGGQGGAGGYLAAGANGDTTTGNEVSVGNGGGGGGGGIALNAPATRCCANQASVFGGGAGGAGGGRLIVRATGKIDVLAGGVISADGLPGNAGSSANGVTAEVAGGECATNLCGGYSGGGGSGGGLLLVCQQSGGCLTVAGSVSAAGGPAGPTPKTGATTPRAGAGGTVKVFCPGCGSASIPNVTAGRRCKADFGALCANF